MRYLATEVGPCGVRVVGLYTAGAADTLTHEELAKVGGGGRNVDAAPRAQGR